MPERTGSWLTLLPSLPEAYPHPCSCAVVRALPKCKRSCRRPRARPPASRLRPPTPPLPCSSSLLTGLFSPAGLPCLRPVRPSAFPVGRGVALWRSCPYFWRLATLLAETVAVAPAAGDGAGAMAVADTLPGVTAAGASDVMAKGTFGGTPLHDAFAAVVVPRAVTAAPCVPWGATAVWDVGPFGEA